MRYTKYNYKKKNKNKVLGILPFIIIISLGIVLGIAMFNLFFIGNNSILNVFNRIDSTEAISNEKVSKLTFASIQCGLYEKRENAENSLLIIPSSFSKFIIEEDGKFKVMAGIYGVEELEDKKSQLENNSIKNFAIKYEFYEDSIDSKVEGEIICGYLKIINRTFNDEVKSINTEEFKTWVKEVSDKSINKSEITQKLLEKINSLPKEYEKEKGEEDIIYLYNIVKEYKI
jgi:hypothetical protein